MENIEKENYEESETTRNQNSEDSIVKSEQISEESKKSNNEEEDGLNEMRVRQIKSEYNPSEGNSKSRKSNTEAGIKSYQANNISVNRPVPSEINHLLSYDNSKSEDPVERSSCSTQVDIESEGKDNKKRKQYNNNDHDHHIYNHENYSQTNFIIPFDQIFSSSIKLVKTNEEFFYLSIFLTIWLGLIMIEFIYGFFTSKVHVISDSFFNYFKTFSFLITGGSILLTRVFTFNTVFLKNRIELMAALSNCVFLIIVSLYMCLEALHVITEPEEDTHHQVENEEKDTIAFLKNFFVVKVILDVVGVLVFSDYIVHPSIQIKLHLWKKHRQWKNLADMNVENLRDCRNLIKNWNNHFENMNALAINISADLLSSILFLICFYISQDNHFEVVYCLISFVNLIILVILISPVLKSIVQNLMQGKSEIYECFYSQLKQEISYFEGCLGIKDIKFWMTAQNSLKCKKYI